jgi:hypothetical protein
MKAPLILTVFLFLCIYSCKREDVDDMADQAPVVSSVDYRDSVIGTYTGLRMSHSRMYPNPTDYYDTIPVTLTVIKDSVDQDKILLFVFTPPHAQLLMTLNSDFTLTGTHQFQYEGGNFTLTNPKHLDFYFGNWGITGGSMTRYVLDEQ